MNILTEKSSKILIWVGLLLFMGGILFFIWNDYHFLSSEKINAEKFGAFGDFIGGLVGSLWAFAGVILFYVALVDQRRDIGTNREALNSQLEALNYQIKEFELQTKELEATRKVFKEQSLTQQQQRFENTFFQLLNNHNNIVNSIDIRNGGNLLSSGRDCFKIYYNKFERRINQAKNSGSNINLNELYMDIFNLYQADLGHYFRNLYHVFKFVDNSKVADKKMYTNFVRAQLSSYELVFLFYNCLSEYGQEKFKPLVERYSLLKNLNKDLLFLSRMLINDYDKSAFS